MKKESTLNSYKGGCCIYFMTLNFCFKLHLFLIPYTVLHRTFLCCLHLFFATFLTLNIVNFRHVKINSTMSWVDQN